MIDPINLKFLSFSDKGATTLERSISISLFIFCNLFFVSRPKIFGKLVASNDDPLIIIFFLKNIEKSLFLKFPSKVLAENFFKDENFSFFKTNVSSKILFLFSLKSNFLILKNFFFLNQ